MTQTKAQKSGSWTPQIQKKAPSLAPPPIVVQRDAVAAPTTEASLPEYTPLEPNALQNHPLMGNISDLPPIQTKLTIGAPGDKYEQEADTIARKVVSQINSPVAQAKPAQAKPATKVLQRQPVGRDITVSPFAGMMQAKEAVGGGPASQNLESSINRAKGGGQPLDAGLQQSMGQAMGADFSGVKVHTDANSHQLNQSIQAKAFTTGQDIFFKQGEYNPGSKDGQELIAHELTHVVQQNGLAVQRSQLIHHSKLDDDNDRVIQQKSLNSSQHLASLQPISYTQAISLQAFFEPAYVNDTAQLHNIDSREKDAGTVSGGKKLKAGDQIEADETDSKGGGQWIAAKAAGKSGYIRKSKVVFKRALIAPTDPEFESDTAEGGKEVTEEFGGGFDAIAGGMEQGFLKENQEGMLQDKENGSPSIEKGKLGLDIAAGVGDTLAGLFGMVANARQISRDKTAWENFASGFGFVESLSKTASGATKIVDSIAKVSGSKDGVGKSDIAGKITGAIGDGLSAVKDAALGVIGIYRLFKSQSDQKTKDALVTFQSFTNAAAGAAKVAKSAFDIIGNGIPMSIIYTVPALGIGVSAINLLIRLWDALKSRSIQGKMNLSADPLRGEIATTLGDAIPTEENVESSKIFDKDRRGTFPNYKTYFRTKKQVREAIKQVVRLAQDRSKNLGDVARDPRRERSVTKRAHNAVIAKIDGTVLDTAVKNKLKNLTGTPKTVAEFRNNSVKPLEHLDQNIDTYEYSDKMAEINQKRQTSGWTDVILELVSMAGDITTIAVGATGIGAAIGQGVKAASGGYKAVHSGAKFIQKLYRNSGDGSDKKSSKNKHKEYVEHAKFIYQQVASLKPGDTAKEKQLEQLIRATGVNYGMWLAVKYNPQTQVEMLVEAMKQR